MIGKHPANIHRIKALNDNMKRLLFSFVLLSGQIAGQTDYVTKYAGAYMVSPDGAEAFTLRSDGSALWVYGWMENGKVKTTQKTGTWTARQGYIKIMINGNTGKIVEEYNTASRREGMEIKIFPTRHEQGETL